MYLGICEVKVASIKLLFNLQMGVNNFGKGYMKEAAIFSHLHILDYNDDEFIIGPKLTVFLG